MFIIQSKVSIPLQFIKADYKPLLLYIQHQAGLKFHSEFVLVDGDFSFSRRTICLLYSIREEGCFFRTVLISAMHFLSSSRLALLRSSYCLWHIKAIFDSYMVGLDVSLREWSICMFYWIFLSGVVWLDVGK